MNIGHLIVSPSMLVSTPQGSFGAYVAKPMTGPAPCMVVVQEIFGINADMRDTCDELARKGFIAICPDLFWRLQAGVDMSDQTEAEWKKGFALYNAFNFDCGVADVAATMKAARGLPDATGKVGLIGFCMGGLLTLLATAAHGADASVAYYPGGAEKHLVALQRIATPTLIHLAERDEYMPAQAQEAIAQSFAKRPTVQMHTYAGCQHAFARHRGIHFDAAAANLANARSEAFLKRHLMAAM